MLLVADLVLMLCNSCFVVQSWCMYVSLKLICIEKKEIQCLNSILRIRCCSVSFSISHLQEEYLLSSTLGNCSLCCGILTAHAYAYSYTVHQLSLRPNVSARGWSKKNSAVPKHRPSIKEMLIFLVRHVLLSSLYKDEKCRIEVMETHVS